MTVSPIGSAAFPGPRSFSRRRDRPLADIANEAQPAGMGISTILPFIMALSWSTSPLEEQRGDTDFYGASVNYREGECWFWTGDVGLTARQFERNLVESYDSARGIVISYTANTPRRCVKLAQRSAIRAGFKTVKIAVRVDAGAVAPPSDGS